MSADAHRARVTMKYYLQQKTFSLSPEILSEISFLNVLHSPGTGTELMARLIELLMAKSKGGSYIRGIF